MLILKILRLKCYIKPLMYSFRSVIFYPSRNGLAPGCGGGTAEKPGYQIKLS